MTTLSKIFATISIVVTVAVTSSWAATYSDREVADGLYYMYKNGAGMEGLISAGNTARKRAILKESYEKLMLNRTLLYDLAHHLNQLGIVNEKSMSDRSDFPLMIAQNFIAKCYTRGVLTLSGAEIRAFFNYDLQQTYFMSDRTCAKYTFSGVDTDIVQDTLNSGKRLIKSLDDGELREMMRIRERAILAGLPSRYEERPLNDAEFRMANMALGNSLMQILNNMPERRRQYAAAVIGDPSRYPDGDVCRAGRLVYRAVLNLDGDVGSLVGRMLLSDMAK